VAEAATIITALGALVTGMAMLITAFRTHRKIEAVHHEVRTLNEATIGELAAKIETRRIEAKQAEGELLTAQEQRHIHNETGGDL
jgi:hypothetical protein